MNFCSGKVPITQNMASGCETRAVDSKGSTSLSPAVSLGKPVADGDILHNRKWEFRPPPRGLTPNEYVLCHR